MFTGIITGMGTIAAAEPTAGGIRLRVDAADFGLDDVTIGDSIAVDGVCLTVVTKTARSFESDVSRETLSCVAGFERGRQVNLEKALRLADRLGGHLVTGHVDAVAIVERVETLGDNRLLEISLPEALAKYVARKGSVALNGVSLTVNDVEGMRFTVNIIPYTLANTTLGTVAQGVRINVEVDMMARYAERLQSTA